MSENDPIKEMLFYTKSNPNEAKHITADQVDQIGRPRSFLNKKMYVFCRHTVKE